MSEAIWKLGVELVRDTVWLDKERARVARLLAAIDQHRRGVWGDDEVKNEVKHYEDERLYAAADAEREASDTANETNE